MEKIKAASPMEAARSIERQGKSGLLLQVSPRSSRALWSDKSRQPSADGPPAGEPQKACWKFGDRQPDADGPGHDGNLFAWLPHKPSRPQSRQRPMVISKMENTASCGHCRSEARKKAPRFRGA